MKPSEVVTYFRDLIDEPDTTFVTGTHVTTYLDTAYGQFRREVSNVDPMIYSKTVDFTLSGDRTMDLTSFTNTAGATANVLGNSVAAGNRMQQLISLEKITGQDDVIVQYVPVSNTAALSFTRYSFTWQGQILRFSGSPSGTFRLRYLPEHTVTWTDSTNQLDDLTMFHDVVALLAYSQYSMRDGLENQPVLRQLNQRIAALREYLNARTLESASYVQNVGWDGYGWQ